MRILLEYNGKPLPRKMLISGLVDHPERNVIAYIDGSAYPFLTESPFYERVVELFSMAEEIGHPDNDSMTGPDLPTLSGYIKEHGWPDWAKYAAIDVDTNAYYYSEEPISDEEEGSWNGVGIKCKEIQEYFDATNWQNSLVEKCGMCNGTGIVSTYEVPLYHTAPPCRTCNGTKIKPKQEPKKRVPLTAKDYRNIRAIRRTCWLEDLERRFSEITREGIIISGIVMSFDYLSRNQQDGAWVGVTFDNKIVPLYKEE